MDQLKSCYTTSMRVRLNPELIATVRWYFTPDGAQVFPGEHAFGSSVWETPDRVYPQAGLGEIDLTRTWDAGVAPPGVTGQATPTPLDWFLNGVPANVTGPLAPCPGTIPVGPILWWRPEEIQGLAAGAPLTTWPAAPLTTITGNGVNPGVNVPPVVVDPHTGWHAADIYNTATGGNAAILSTSQTVHLGTDFTFYLVGWESQNTSPQAGPAVEGSSPATLLLFAAQLGTAFSETGPGSVSGPDPFTLNDLHVWRVRMRGGNHVSIDRADCGPFRWTNVLDDTAHTWPGGTVNQFVTSFGNLANDFHLLETILWPRALADVELASVDSYLASKYCRPNLGDYRDMLIGQIVWDAGADAVPALFLPANGMAVSRTTYSLLFGRLGTVYGAGDGVSTFNLPNLQDFIPYGSGHNYAIGAVVGNDSPTLNANQVPAHTHPVTVTDTGHTHPPLTGGGAGFMVNAALFASQSGSGQSFSVDATTGTATTGITAVAGNNTTTGQALDVRQKGVALRPLIYAGQ